MAQTPAITTVFLDVGSVLLTDSWGPSMRQKALAHFSFDFAEVADRSRLTFEGYEEGNISLEEYLDWVVFYQERPFSRKAIIDFMLAQSQPHPEMLELMRALKARYGLKIVVVTNDGREFAIHRIRQFGLTEFVDFFIVSCFVHCRKPEPEIYRLALDLSQTPPARAVFIDDQLLFVEVAQKLGVHGIHHTDYASTKAALATLGLSLAS
ncbi:MAG: HAD family phosphatase [Deltaproteobacteria bacterium]|nr:HAD family phosphatase [Deltaproteobacteria bacterium]